MSSTTDDVTELTQLVLRERRARDRGWWRAMGECLAPDAAVRLSWFRGTGAEFVAASREMAARGDTALHSLHPPVVDVHGPRAVIEMLAGIHLRADLNGVEVDLTSRARLLYRAERRAGRWVLVSLDPVYEYDVLLPAVPGARPAVDPQTLAAARPSYRMLTCLLHARGYAVGADLYGDDRPEEVRALYASLFEWLTPGGASVYAD